MRWVGAEAGPWGAAAGFPWCGRTGGGHSGIAQTFRMESRAHTGTSLLGLCWLFCPSPTCHCLLPSHEPNRECLFARHPPWGFPCAEFPECCSLPGWCHPQGLSYHPLRQGHATSPTTHHTAESEKAWISGNLCVNEHLMPSFIKKMFFVYKTLHTLLTSIND